MTTRLNNLQALRAYAAASVVMVHVSPACGVPTFGYYGVDIFFVLSGYLMTRIAATDSDWFFPRRLARILPAYWTLTLLVYAVAWLIPSLLHSVDLSPGALAKSLAFVPYCNSNGLIRPIVFLGWTLNYEMYFYLILALCLKLNKRRAPFLTACLISVPPIISLFVKTDSVVFNSYASVIVLEFIFGMAVYYLTEHFRNAKVNRPAFLLVLWGLLLTLPIIQTHGWLNAMTIWPGILGAIIVASALFLENAGISVRNRYLLLVGDASYILYLFHPYPLPVIAKAFHVLNLNGAARYAWVIGLIAFSAVMSCLLHLWLEKPLLNYFKRFFQKDRPPGPAKPVIVGSSTEITPVG